MSEAAISLPDDVESPHRIIAGLTGELAAAKAGLVTKTLEIEPLKVQLARLRQQRFGRSSEKLDRQIAQLKLVLEELEIAAEIEAPAVVEAGPVETASPPPGRG